MITNLVLGQIIFVGEENFVHIYFRLLAVWPQDGVRMHVGLNNFVDVFYPTADVAE
jgi:hypothetical protein